MGQKQHPVKVHSAGGMFVWDSDQESPNVQSASWQYADGSLMAMEITNVYSPGQGPDTIFFTTKGYVLPGDDDKWQYMIGDFTPRDRPEVSAAGVNDKVAIASAPAAKYSPGPAIPDEPSVDHFRNFIDCVRSRKVEDLYCDIEQGHLSTVLAHQANISFRLGRSLEFDPKTERFVGDEEANKHLTREYREPYVLPKEV
jgi:hypothetical protein